MKQFCESNVTLNQIVPQAGFGVEGKRTGLDTTRRAMYH